MSLYEEYLEFWPRLDSHILDPAKQAVFSIMGDMLDRGGFRNSFDDCDDEIKEEMIQAWIDCVRNSLSPDAVQKLQSCKNLCEQISEEEVSDPEELMTEFACEGKEFSEAIDVVLKGFGQAEEE